MADSGVYLDPVAEIERRGRVMDAADVEINGLRSELNSAHADNRDMLAELHRYRGLRDDLLAEAAKDRYARRYFVRDLLVDHGLIGGA